MRISTHDGVVASWTERPCQLVWLGPKRGGGPMTDFEIVMIVVAIAGLPVAVVTLLVELLEYLDLRYKKRK